MGDRHGRRRAQTLIPWQGRKISLSEPEYNFEEFKVYYESTERVSDRRISTTSDGNYSVGVCVSRGRRRTNQTRTRGFYVLRPWPTCGSIRFHHCRYLLGTLWLRQIDDFKNLNNAKFTVLNSMAPRIRFPLSASRMMRNRTK